MLVSDSARQRAVKSARPETENDAAFINFHFSPYKYIQIFDSAMRGRRSPNDHAVQTTAHRSPQRCPPGPNQTRGDAPLPSRMQRPPPSAEGVRFPTDRRRLQTSGVRGCVGLLSEGPHEPTRRGRPRNRPPRRMGSQQSRRGVQRKWRLQSLMQRRPDRQQPLPRPTQKQAAVCAARSRRHRRRSFGCVWPLAEGSEGRRRAVWWRPVGGLAAR